MDVKLLVECKYLPSQIEEIITIIESVSYSKGNTNSVDNLNLEIVRDADRLDALGAMGIIRTIEYGTSKKRLFYEEENILRENDCVTFNKSTETTLSHFYDKLLKLKDYMHTFTAKKIAIKRTEFIENFLNEFYEELK